MVKLFRPINDDEHLYVGAVHSVSTRDNIDECEGLDQSDWSAQTNEGELKAEAAPQELEKEGALLKAPSAWLKGILRSCLRGELHLFEVLYTRLWQIEDVGTSKWAVPQQKESGV